MKSTFYFFIFLLLILLLSVNTFGQANNQIIENYGNIPLAFQLNSGRFNEQVKFTTGGNGATMFFTGEGTTFLLGRETGESLAKRASLKKEAIFDTPIPQVEDIEMEHFALKLNFNNANTQPDVSGEDRLPWNTNYLLGNDPDKWRTDVSNYAKVRLSNLYNGVDLLYYGNKNRIKYDFVVEPGADPGQILLSYDFGDYYDSDLLTINNEGELEVKTPLGNLIEKKPYCYQIIDGNEIEVAVQYKIVDKDLNRFTFDVSEYNTDYPLIIDPELVYSSYLGGSGDDTAISIDVDNSGNTYVSGYTSSANFPVTSGAYSEAKTGNFDAFVCKLNPAGTELIYSTYIGGSDEDTGINIKIDSSGSAYLVGYTKSSNFPTTSGAFDESHNGDYDAFAVKLNSSGNTLIYSTYIGGSSYDVSITGIAIDISGNIYIGGQTASSNFPVTSGAYDESYNDGYDGFIIKLNPSGSALIFSTFLGGSQSESAGYININSSGNIITSSSTASSDFPITPGAYDENHNGSADVFITIFNPDGDSIIYSTFIGGSDSDALYDVTLDNSDNIYIAGRTYSADYPTTSGAYDESYNGDLDVFVTKFNPSGTSLQYSTYIGSSGFDASPAIAVDNSENLYAAVTTASTDFPTTPGTYDDSYNGGEYDIGLFKLTASGNSLLYSTYIGGSNREIAYGFEIDNNNNAYITGHTKSSNFPVTSGAYDENYAGSLTDGFVTKFAMSTASDTFYTIAASADTGGAISPSGNVSVLKNSDRTFIITPNSGYGIDDVLVDSVSQGAISSYTFTNVTENHTIQAIFDSVATYNITASVNDSSSGTISPSGENTVNENSDITFYINANSGFEIDSVLVDSVSQGAITSYTFSSVDLNHTIHAIFSAIPSYTVIALADSGGTIAPSGTLAVAQDSSITFTITPNSGFEIDSVMVDSVSQGAITSYTFSNIDSNHTIHAIFSPIPSYTVIALADSGGTIAPSGTLAVAQDSSITFTITPDTGYTISDVLVDNISQGAITSYTFSNVDTNHTISASFDTVDVGNWYDLSSFGLNSNYIKSIAIDLSGNKWFGIGSTYSNEIGGGVSKFDGINWTTHTTSDGLTHNNVISIAIDSGGNKWFGTIEGGVSKFDGTNWTTYTTAEGLAHNYVTSIAIDSDGNKWFGTWGGVSKFDGINWITYTVSDGLGYPSVCSIAIDADGNKWFGTPAGGVSKFDGTNWITYTTSDGLAHNYVLSIAIDADGNKWFGTNTGGVSKFDGTNWTTYTTSDGLVNNQVLSIAIDSSGNKWFGTYGGVSKFDGTNWTTYTTSDGLAHNTVHSIAIDTDGNKWFGTEGGVCFLGNSSIFPSVTYTISMSLDFTKGSLSPAADSLSATVFQGADQNFRISLKENFEIADVLVDGASQGAISSYTFTNVTANHTLAVLFDTVSYTITASAGTGGTISPSGDVSVNIGTSKTFTITPNSGYEIDSVLVDSVSQGVITSYTFSNVDSNHTIHAIFSPIPSYTVIALADSGGTIAPSGTLAVAQDSSITFTITPNSGYETDSVMVDSISQGPITSYTFSSVDSNHTIHAIFSPIPSHTVIAIADSGGTIAPSGTLAVAQ
ncbi:SBBP repeat-containing protein, partial [candidate division KSB1 bacterium]